MLVPLAPEKNLNFETKKVKITGVLSGNTQTLTGTGSGSASGSSAKSGKGTLTSVNVNTLYDTTQLLAVFVNIVFMFLISFGKIY